ncbi:hypothetical protein TYRP_000859 [Tyrophagus putrescentiae]|nr:hypothetical protein TYRP_000859 [Tyrophagus putrescentiae]
MLPPCSIRQSSSTVTVIVTVTLTVGRWCHLPSGPHFTSARTTLSGREHSSGPCLMCPQLSPTPTPTLPPIYLFNRTRQPHLSVLLHDSLQTACLLLIADVT